MIMRTAYRVIAYLLALSVAVQASLIAFGAFALENNIDNGPVSDGDTTGVTLHQSFAYVVVLFALALLAVSFGAKVQHGVRWAAIPLGLVVVQSSSGPSMTVFAAPPLQLFLFLVLGAVTGILAGLRPARRAARQNMITAITAA